MKNSLFKISKRNFNYYLDYHKTNSFNTKINNIQNLYSNNLHDYSIADTKDLVHTNFIPKQSIFAYSFISEVIGICMNPELLKIDGMISPEAKELASKYLNEATIGAYTDSKGIATIRKRIISRFEQQEGLKILSENNIFLTSGAVNAYDHVSTLIFKPGEQVMVSNPFYPPILNHNRSKGVNNLYVNLKDDWSIDVSII